MNRETAVVEWQKRLKKRHQIDEEGYYDFGLIVYGSLLHPEEISTVFGQPSMQPVPVRVEGYRRVFNKYVSERLRKPRGNQAAVLNLRPRESSWFNGLVIPFVSPEGLDKYASREREYRIERIPSRSVRPTGGGEIAALDSLNPFYTCLLEEDEKLSEDIDPIPSYLELCLAGARNWGDSFEQEFLRSTWTRKTRLLDYVNRTTTST